MKFDENSRQEFCKKDKTLMMIVNDTHRLFGHQIHNLISNKGIPNTVNCILFHLVRNDSLTQVEIVNKTHLRASTISVCLQKMEVDGLIERVSNDDDQRYLKVSITSKGYELYNEMDQAIHEMDLQLTSDINKEEIEIAKKVLKELCCKMSEEGNK